MFLWRFFCIRRLSASGISAIIGMAQSGWWFVMFDDWSDRLNRTAFPSGDLLFGIVTCSRCLVHPDVSNVFMIHMRVPPWRRVFPTNSISILKSRKLGFLRVNAVTGTDDLPEEGILDSDVRCDRSAAMSCLQGHRSLSFNWPLLWLPAPNLTWSMV